MRTKALITKDGVATLAAAILLILPHTAEAQVTRQLTIADCPAGWQLGISETTDAQPVYSTSAGTPAVATKPSDGLTADKSPKQFVTACIPPQPLNQPQQ